MPSSATPMSAPLPTIAERFADLSQQQAASRLGMWVFLASETLLFAGLFGLWATYRAHYPAGFLVAAQHDTLALGTINTFVLLTSSLLAALAVWAVAHERRGLGLAVSRGLAAVVVRPCPVYGPGHRGRLSKMLGAVRRGFFPPPAEGAAS